MFVFSSFCVKAQSYFGEGDQKLQVGFNLYGFGSGIKVTYDYGINDKFSAGGGASFYTGGKYNRDLYFYARGDWHVNYLIDTPSELDLYTGLELGLIGSDTFGVGAHIGGRYNIARNIDAFLEIGNNAALGVAFHL